MRLLVPRRSAVLAVLLLAAGIALAAVPLTSPVARAATPAATPPIGHVWVVVLENKSYAESFSDTTAAPYLGKVLTGKGAFLRQYYGTGHLSLDNYVSLLSGQAPNLDTQADCQTYTDFVATGVTDADGQAVGQGCVYPASVKTLVDQLGQKGLSWKGYMEDMGNDPTREEATCGRPSTDTLMRDQTQSAEVGDQYAARHNPFVYFHSVVDDLPSCQSHVVPLPALTTDLADAATTPAFSFITPNLCDDGHDAPCVDGRPGGLASADAFLQQWVPRILTSPAFGKDGLLLITWDEAETTGDPFGDSLADSRACCNEPTGPNTVRPGGPATDVTNTQSGAGGGQIGAVALSPYITPGTVTDVPYNHYSALRSLEDLYGVAHLGYAGRDGLVPFGQDVYSALATPAVPERPGQQTAAGVPSADLPAAAVTPAPATSRSLASTGGTPLAGLAAALVLAGLVVLAVGRRREV